MEVVIGLLVIGLLVIGYWGIRSGNDSDISLRFGMERRYEK
jgi:hypothetical protein